MKTLLREHEPRPVSVLRGKSDSPFLLTCDHASSRFPEALGDLGLSDSDRRRHIAWDIGAAGMALALSELLDAPLVLQNYSRLVIDCNRPFENPESIPVSSEDTEVPGNRDLTDEAVEARQREIFAPYHAELVAQLDARKARGIETLVIAVHSFTPVYRGDSRIWDVGLLYNRDRRLAEPMFELLAEKSALCVGDNQPYQVDDEHDYGTPVHGEGRGLPNVVLEVRQDHLLETGAQRNWAGQLARVLEGARKSL